MAHSSPAWIARVVAVAFVTMAIAVTARTGFSLLFPPLIAEFGWDRAVIAGAFSFGFILSACASPPVGRIMDTKGPRVVVGTGVLLMGLGLVAAPRLTRPLELYLTLGVLLCGGAGLMTYTTHSLFLPNWFVRQRAFAISVAFSARASEPSLSCPGFKTSSPRKDGVPPVTHLPSWWSPSSDL